MNIDRKTASILATWGIALLINLSAAVISIAFIFMPLEEHRLYGGEEFIVKQSAISLYGGALLVESWKEYPQYITALGAAGALSLIGACFCVYNIYKNEAVPE